MVNSLGVILILFEIISNVSSGLNDAILLSFHGELKQAHKTFRVESGLFYPSIYLFAMWQAYNKAFVINCHQDGEKPPKETYLTGFFFGGVIGMNLGIYWSHNIWNDTNFLGSPIFNGLTSGIIVGVIGHLIDRYYKSKKA